MQVDRLRDQVYRLILEDLKSGEFKPGSRLVEGHLAKRYSVSRTPVREALFQLSREGKLSTAERGYEVATDDDQTTIDRHEVRELLDPRLAYLAASGSQASKRELSQILKQEQAAHETNNVDAFIEANLEFRETLRSMCRNSLLARCSALLDDQAQPTRRRMFSAPHYRELEFEHDQAIAQAIIAGDAEGAEQAMRAYILMVKSHLETIF
ncbi:GntR family transcriptional regulator [Novosphingobium flavum]|uniref:GntR family transcriptional regulator n=1 Tax=Novosphingobium aerophilum TaxID=2839843 RepID=A0A7X1FAP4_9SPHN|nr:GntR family transcriptional regulator [Novosphingobium aerophilum]